MGLFDNLFSSGSSSLGSSAMDNYARNSITPSFQYNQPQSSSSGGFWQDLGKGIMQNIGNRSANNFSSNANPNLPQVNENPGMAQMMNQMGMGSGSQQQGQRPVFDSTPWSTYNQTKTLPREGGASNDQSLGGLIAFLSSNQAAMPQVKDVSMSGTGEKGILGNALKSYLGGAASKLGSK
jgi:hypothetical protein